MKNAQEFIAFLSSAVNSGVEVAADKKVGPEDLAYILDTALKAAPAFQEFGDISGELAIGSVDDYVELQNIVGQELTALDEKKALLVHNVINGLFSGWGLVATIAFEKGVEAGYAAGIKGASVQTALGK